MSTKYLLTILLILVFIVMTGCATLDKTTNTKTELPTQETKIIEDSGIDMLLGIGAAPEGVLAAAALKTLGGEIQGRLHFRNKEERKQVAP